MKKKTTKLNNKPAAAYVFTSREALVDTLRDLRRAGKIKVADIARVTGVKSSSASCWIQEPPKSLPTKNRIDALVELINSVK